MFFKLVILCTLAFDFSQGAVVHNRSLTQLDLQNFDLNGRIIGGNKAGFSQFPWQAGINVVHGDRTYFCGGALITPEWILTAAHCIYRASSFMIRLGALKSSGDYESGLQEIRGARGVNHPQYNPDTLNNDIGLIMLAESANLNQYVSPIHLPNPKYLFPPGTEVTVSGWGLIKTGGTLNMDLMYVMLKTITNDLCQDYYNSEIITHSTICCQGITTESPCHGDDGGPLVRYVNGVAHHVGVVSLIPSIGCEHGIPSVYVRTVSFLDWIQEVTGVN